MIQEITQNKQSLANMKVVDNQDPRALSNLEFSLKILLHGDQTSSMHVPRLLYHVKN